MNTIKNVPARVLSRRPGHSLEAEREQFDKTQAISISKAINTQEAPVKEKHARRIILGTHHEKGAFTFWSYAIGLPLPSSSILSWKFCHVLHKVLRDGHPNVLHDCQRYRSNIREIGDLWVSVENQACSFLAPFLSALHRLLRWPLIHSSCPPGLPADTLQGHRDRFHEQFHSLRNFFRRASDMLYFKRLIQIPRLPEGPPNFLRASALAEHIKPVVVIPDEAPEDEEPENLIEISSGPPAGEPPVRAWGPSASLTAQRYITQLKGQVNGLEAELEEQRKQKQKALVDNEQLRDELEQLRKARLEQEKAQGLYQEAEKKASATEARYNKLKEKHSELINTHAELLRKNADTAKQLTVTQQSQEEVARVKEQLAFQMEQVKRESEMKLEDQSYQLEKLKRELEAKAGELVRVQETLSHKEQSGSELSSKLDAMHLEKESLSSTMRQRESELQSAQSLVEEKEAALIREQERSSREIGELQGKLAEKDAQHQGLQQRLLDEQLSVLQAAVTEAENTVKDAVSKLDDPLHLRCTSSPDYLVSRAQAALDALSALEKGHRKYVASMTDSSALVAALAQFSHLAADTIVNGSATSHLAPTDHADRLTDTCRDCGARSLEYLGLLKDRQSLDQADPSLMRGPLQGILQLGQELKPKSLDVRQEELGDLVDKEMAATSAAIENAVQRIEDMMNQARHESSGVKLEVNERWGPPALSVSSLALHQGAATQQEFYAKNSRWTEGLISASKAVGWGATQLVESADKVVLHTGKYEELIVCSHEIAASTAQLVAASKVKADKNSRNLSRLQECSRAVNEMAANVVASTKSGQEQIEDRDTMDFSGMSLIKLKKEEMETQVKVLELEKTLENERRRLGELRKRHYALAGVIDDGAEDEPLGRPVASPRKGILKKPPLAQKPSVGPKPDCQLEKEDGISQAQLMNS
uniref:Huntingtin interacting protein 1 related n=1 Tax=Monodelphis domestica TaxID=13616 RepID=A0A5F8HFF5_MONDO